jgi:hypothetical protein
MMHRPLSPANMTIGNRNRRFWVIPRWVSIELEDHFHRGAHAAVKSRDHRSMLWVSPLSRPGGTSAVWTIIGRQSGLQSVYREVVMGVSIAFDALRRSSAQLCLRCATALSIVVLFTTIALSSALGQQQIGEGDLPNSLFAPPFYFVQSLLPPHAISCFCENLGTNPGYYCLFFVNHNGLVGIERVGPPSLCPPVHTPFILTPNGD